MVQTIQIICFIISNLLLKGFTGAIIQGVSLIRNIEAYKDKLTTLNKIILITISVGLSLYFNNRGIIGLLPVISTIVYTSFMTTKDVKKLKLLLMFTMVLWGVYDFYIMSYTSAVFDGATFIANAVVLLKLRFNKSVN